MDIVIRACIGFLFILFITRVVGRRELSTMQPFDLILLIVLGDLIQQGITQSDYSVTGLVLAGGTMAVMTVITSYLSFRVRWTRPILDGEPIVIVKHGRPIDGHLRRERITLEELAASARLQGIERIADVKWAVLETNGQISFIKQGS
jgi:uncharacterized membrane protein YcaP (DUF421 family)